MLYAVWLNGACVGRVYVAWPRPDGEADPVAGADRLVLVTEPVGDCRHQVFIWPDWPGGVR